MLSANTETSPLCCHSSRLRGIYPASKGAVSLWSDDMDLIPGLKIWLKKEIFITPPPFLSNAHAGQPECGCGNMWCACWEEWNWELNTEIQTVHQRVLGCKLCIISNWVSSALLLKSATLLGFFFLVSFFQPLQVVFWVAWQEANQ